MSPNSQRNWTKESLLRARDRLNESQRAEPSPARFDMCFHDAAAVLAWFELNPTLRPTNRDAEEDNRSIAQLIHDSISLGSQGHSQRWTLKNDVRKRILERLGTREAIRNALAANMDRPRNALQLIFEQCINDNVGALDKQSADQLSALLQVLDWLPSSIKDSSSTLPEADDIRIRIAKRALIEPFKLLANDSFSGRRKELAALRDYVGVREPSSSIAWVKRSVREVFNWSQKPPLVIYGPGGMGKSTLLARFILDHTEGSGPVLPFVYLDCDRPGLTPDEPLTLLLEAVRQLGIQFPAHRRAAGAWVNQRTRELSTSVESADANDPSIYGTRNRDATMQSCRLFIEELGLDDAPLLFVIDTFEEVQYRGNAYVQELWRFLEELQGLVPRLRTVVAGRARVRDVKHEPLPLDYLDQEAAVAFLDNQGIKDTNLASALAKQLRGNPLSLKLAAQVLRYETPDDSGVRSLATGSFFKRVDDNRVQGELHRRILSHIKDENVRKLAHPGLILRLITPELILEVLAKPCSVSVKNLDEAERLFEELKREVSLVNCVAGTSREVRHRADVRRVMLELLRKSEPERVAEIERTAVTYFARFDNDLAARAEEIYHRIGLGQSITEVSSRWVAGVEDYLRNAIDDFTGPSQAVLATLLGVETLSLRLDDQPDDTWEVAAAKQAEDLLRLGQAEEALRLLSRRSMRSQLSPLYVLEARALNQMGRAREARQVTRAAIDEYHGTVDNEVLDLEVLEAQANEFLGEAPEFDVLERYDRLTKALSPDIRLVSLGVTWARTIRFTQGNTSKLLKDLGNGFVHNVTMLPDFTLAQNPELLKQVIQSGLIQDRDAALSDRLTALGQSSSPPPWPVDSPEARAGHASETVRLSEPLTRLQTDSLIQALDSEFTASEFESLLAQTFKERLFNVTANRNTALAATDVLAWTEEQGMTSVLIDAAHDARPDNTTLRELALLDTFVSYRIPSGRLVHSALLDGGRPLLDRLQLREYVDTIDDADQAPVYLVSGPRGSGKSYSANFIDFVARRTGRFDMVKASVIGQTPRQLASDLCVQAQWNPNSMPAPGSQSQVLASWFVAQSARRRRVTVVVVDDIDQADYEMSSFIRGLVDMTVRTSNPTTRFVLLGADPKEYVRGTHQSRIMLEMIRPLDVKDVARFLSDVGGPQATQDALGELPLGTLYSANSGASSRVQFNSKLRELAIRMLGRSGTNPNQSAPRLADSA